MKKKVLFMLSRMIIGGTEKAFLNLLDTMSPEQYEVTLLLLKRCGEFLEAVPDWVKVESVDDFETLKHEIMDPPIPIVKDYLREGKIQRGTGIALTHLWFKLTGDRAPYYRFVLRGTQKKRDSYDVAVAFAGPEEIISVYIQEQIKAPVKVQWVHTDVEKSDFNVGTCRKLFQKFQHIFVVSEKARQSLLSAIPEIKEKTRLMPNVISANLCRQQANCGESYDDGYNGTRILTMGRLSVEKGQDIIPDIAADLVAMGIDFRWYLIGDGKLRDTIEKKIAALGITDRVKLLGTKTNPYAYLKNADLYVHTSLFEGRCVVIDEARVFNLPIVTTDVAGTKEQLDGLTNARIVNRDKDEILRAVLQLLGK